MATRNPYDDGLGTGGKFRKRPLRKTQTTPYDRPPTAVRNLNNINGNNRNNGWLSKLMDPAQRLITSSAQMLFGSVFRKRLPPPPLLPLRVEPDVNQNVRDENCKEEDDALLAKKPLVIQEGETTECDDLSNRPNSDGLTELEQILGQKTFTRSEIDRLTTLLHSRTVGTSLETEKSSEAIHSESLVSYERKDEIQTTPIRVNETQNHLTSTLKPSVLDEDIASPAELARAYMGGRPSKVSPSMLGLRSQVVREDPIVPSNRVFVPKSPTLSVVPRSSDHVVVAENSYITPRPRGRSAIYSMARTPYSRLHSTAIGKASGRRNDVLNGPSVSSMSFWEQNKLSGSKQLGSRQSSALHNDDGIGSVGPIRRTRHRSSLLPSRDLRLPAYGSPLSVRSVDVGSDAQPSTSRWNTNTMSEVKLSFAKSSAENADNSAPGTNYLTTPNVSSKSSAMASKILEQLDKLVSTRDKSPTKLSPTMLQGSSLKSFDKLESFKKMVNFQFDVKASGSLDSLRPDGNKSMNSPTKLISARDISSHDTKRVEASGSIDDSVPSSNIIDSTAVNAITLPQKKRAFQMSANENSLDMDENDCSNGVASNSLAEGGKSLETSLMGSNKPAVSEMVDIETAPLSEAKLLASSLMNREVENGTSGAQPATLFTKPITPVSKAASPQRTNSASLFSFGEKPKESNGTLNFTSTNSSSAVKESSGHYFGTPPDNKLRTHNSLATDVGTLTGTSGSNNGAANNSTQTGSLFSFSAATQSTTLNNGSLGTGPSPLSFTSSAHVLNNTSKSVSTSTTGNCSNNTNNCSNNTSNSYLSTTAVMPSDSTATPVFKFGSSVTLTSTSAVTATSGSESIVAKTTDTNFGNLIASPFAVACHAAASSGLGLTVPVCTANQSQATNPFMAGFTQASANGFGNSTSFQSTSINFGSSAPAPTFGLTGNTSFSNGASSSAFGISSSLGPNNSLSSSSSTTSSMVGSSCQPTKSPLFSTTFNSSCSSFSTVFSNVVSSSGATASTSSLIGHGSAAVASSSPVFSFNSTPPANILKPVSGNSNPGFTINSGSSGSNDQMNMEDSMAEDTVEATPSAVPVFGQQSSAPQSNFVFGSTPSSGSSPFQFGGQQNNPVPQAHSAGTGEATPSAIPVFGQQSSAPTSNFVFGSTPSSGSIPFQFGGQQNNPAPQAHSTRTVEATPSAIPVFGQQSSAPQSNFVFGSTPSSVSSTFQFGGQHGIPAPQTHSPFQASNMAAGASFSLGSGGGDKSGRRIVKVKTRNRKK